LVYRFPDTRALTKIAADCKKLKSRAALLAKEEAEKKSIKKQEKLILDTSGKYPRISNVFIRPFISGRNQLGILEAHKNGFRFNSKGSSIGVCLPHASTRCTRVHVLIVGSLVSCVQRFCTRMSSMPSSMRRSRRSLCWCTSICTIRSWSARRRNRCAVLCRGD
jgi:hypothetical protein